jgi:predicted O-linked N-acetylglucosamine transferase (SPINDLY family)
MFYVITEILKRDNRAVVIITKMTPDYDKTFFNEMKEAINPELIGRVRFIPRLGIPDIYNLMYISDIILESFPFGNLNTTLESFEVSTPIITLPNFKLNGRFSFGLIEKMKSKNNDETLNLMIAENVEDYINKAVYIVNNKDFNLRLRESIKNNRDVLFMENKALNDWIKLLVDLTGFYEKKDD